MAATGAPSILIDTSAYAQFRRGEPTIVDLLARTERVHVCAITLGELEGGFILGRRLEENRAALRDFLNEPFVSIVQVDQAVTNRYGKFFAELRRAGTPVPVNDLWIAASALHVRAQLVTFDSDFSRFRDLDVVILKN